MKSISTRTITNKALQTKILKYSLVAVLLWVVVACRKENVDVDITANQWYAYKVKGAEEEDYTKLGDTVLLNFPDQGRYGLKLTVNGCGGSYQIPENGTIAFEYPACTKVGGDSEFSLKVQDALVGATNYYGKGRTLVLSGTGGELILKPLEEN